MDSTSITTNDEDYPEIPEDLQSEILSWLPGKSLAAFNCVSKFWNHSLTISSFLLHHFRSPISNPITPQNNVFYICSSHLYQCFPDVRHSNGSDNVNYAYDVGFNAYNSNSSYNPNQGFRLPLASLPSFYESGKFGVSNFCNDLICMFTGSNYLPQLSMLVYSVRFHDFVVLPVKNNEELSAVSASSYGYVGRLLFCSLGFDPLKEEYKIVRIVSGDNCTNKYEILTIGSNSKSWKSINDDHVPVLLKQGLPHEGSFCLNGVNYWVMEYDYSGENDGRIGIAIVGFDLGCEEFRVYKVDELVGGMGFAHKVENQYYLTALKECVTLFCWNKLEVVELTLSNGVWTRKGSMYNHFVKSISRDYQYVGSKIIVCERNAQRYVCYDLEKEEYLLIKFDVEHETNRVLRIQNDMEGHITSSI